MTDNNIALFLLWGCFVLIWAFIIAAVAMISNMYMYDMFDENNTVIDKFRKEK